MKNLIRSLAIALVAFLSAIEGRAQLEISEFMASNVSGLADEDGDRSDWIEIHNPTLSAVNLLDWALTDNPANLTQWRFPATNLAAGAHLVVFASAKDRRTPGAPLHTNFRLGAGGEYLALVHPDGQTIAAAFAPLFPPQVANVSFGLDPGLRSVTLLPTNAVGRWHVPANDALGTNWIFPGFNDSSWQSVTSAVGFAIGALDRLPSPTLTNGLMSYWKFDETNGTVAAESSGRGVAGTLMSFPANPSPWQPGRNDGALRFRGLAGQDFVRVPSYPRATNALTVAAWVFAEGHPTWASIAKNWSGAGGQFHFGLRDTAGDLDIFINTSAGQFSAREGSRLPSNSWQHVAFTADGAFLRLYRNGTQVAVVPCSGNFLAPPVAALGIGTKLNDAGTAADAGAPGPWHGRIDDLALWHRALGSNELRLIASAGAFPGLTMASDVRAGLHGVNAGSYLRFPFVVETPALLTQWRLRLRFDDGFVAWVNGEEIVRRNAPELTSWNSSALAERDSSESGLVEEFNLAEFTGFIRPGTNVLAIHGLNLAANDLDFLVQPEIEASSITDTTNALVYFTTPTPGAANQVGVAELGPILTEATHVPRVPRDEDALIVTTRVAPAFNPVVSVTLRYRIMFSNEVSVPMHDDGAHADGAAGDGLYGASIPASASTNGQMIRYAILATDSAGLSSRLPVFNKPTDSDEYLGTVVENPAIDTDLPVFHWFLATPAQAETATGTRCSLFYNGELYDNVFVRIRGGTSRGWPKKSYKIELNEDHEFALDPDQPRVTEFDFNTTYTDKSYLRSILVYEHQRDAGLPTPLAFLAHLRQNGAFYSVTIYTEQPDKDFLRRTGLDEKGSFYKCGPGSTYDVLTSFEKKTRIAEGTADLQALIAGLGATGAALDAFVFDHLDVPGMVNFMATVAITQNIDASDKNHFLHRDTEGTREWRMLPWDQDLSFGPDALNTDTIVYNLQTTNTPACASHPFIGARPYLLHAGKYNRLLEAIVKTPRTREMLLRRIRTLTEQFLVAPYFQQRLDHWAPIIGPDVLLDKARWAGSASFPGTNYSLAQAIVRIKNEYLAPRAGYLTSLGIAGVGSANPAAQPPNALVSILSVEASPASGNPAEEFICLTNGAPFALELTGWRLEGGVEFTFKPGTVLPAAGVLYVSPDVAAFRARAAGPRGGQGLFVTGGYRGQLSARGETLSLRNHYGQIVHTFATPPAPSPAQQFLRISELMYHPAALEGSALGVEEFEFVEVKNISPTETLDLNNVRFVDGIEFNFTGRAAVSLAPGQTAVLARNPGALAARYGMGINIAGTFTGELANGGERLRLIDARGEEILDFAYDNQWHPITDGLGFSLVVVDEAAEPDAWGKRSQWRPSGRLDGSPGTGEPGVPSIPPVVIGEALTRSDVPPPTDTIELHNPSATPADISGWYLSDDFNQPWKHRIAAGTLIPAGGFFTLNEAQFNQGPTAFALSSDGDEVWLFSADSEGRLTGYVHGHRFGAAEDGVSFGRHILSTGEERFLSQSAASLGGTNIGPRVGPLVISEIHYHPAVPAEGGDDSGGEFVELRNISGQQVNLWDAANPSNTWKVTGGVNFIFGTNQSIAPGESVLLVQFHPTNGIAAAAFRSRFGLDETARIHGPLQGKLNNAGDVIDLMKPTTPVADKVPYVLIDRVPYRDAAPWPVTADGSGLSLQKMSDGLLGEEPAHWTAAPPTPGTPRPSGLLAPSIVTSPQSQSLAAYQPVQFTVSAGGSGPLQYQWRLNGKDIPGATNSLMRLSNTQPEDAGDYTVLVYNGAGSVLSAPATLSLHYPPFIQSQPTNVLVRVKPDPAAAPITNAAFSVTAYSPVPVTYQWLFNGVEIAGATASTLVVSNAQIANGGHYAVRVTDEVGSMLSAPASLIPLVSPVLTQGPVGQMVPAGATVTLSAAATGSPLPFGFEWRRGSLVFASNTVNAYSGLVTFTVTNAPFTTNQYRVLVRNLANVGVSANATATLITLPDFDADGIVDAYEQSIGLNTNNAADALGDLDGDGMRNVDEVIAGTNPLDPGSVLKLSLDAQSSEAMLQLLAVSNRTYTVQAIDALGSGPWSNVTNLIALPTNRTEVIRHGDWTGERFYRVVTPAQP